VEKLPGAAPGAGAGVVALGALAFGVDEKDREGLDGSGELFGVVNSRLPELKPPPLEKERLLARAGEAKRLSRKSSTMTRARKRLSPVRDRMAPHPSGRIAGLIWPS